MFNFFWCFLKKFEFSQNFLLSFAGIFENISYPSWVRYSSPGDNLRQAYLHVVLRSLKNILRALVNGQMKRQITFLTKWYEHGKRFVSGNLSKLQTPYHILYQKVKFTSKPLEKWNFVIGFRGFIWLPPYYPLLPGNSVYSPEKPEICTTQWEKTWIALHTSFINSPAIPVKIHYFHLLKWFTIVIFPKSE